MTSPEGFSERVTDVLGQPSGGDRAEAQSSALATLTALVEVRPRDDGRLESGVTLTLTSTILSTENCGCL